MRDIVSAPGVVQDHVVYDSFGNIVTETNATNGDRFKYAGMQYDSTVGQYYDHARYYSSLMGRFEQEDPMAFATHDANLYRYVENDATGLTDPAGYAPFPPIPPIPPIPPSYYLYASREYQRQFNFYNNAYIIELRKYESITLKIKAQGQFEQRAIEALLKSMKPSIEQAVARHSGGPVAKIEFDIGELIAFFAKQHERQQQNAELASLAREQAASEGRQMAYAQTMAMANKMQDYFQSLYNRSTQNTPK
jgi:RHS repeat-associated protein